MHKKYFTCKHSVASLGQESYKYEIQTMAGIHAFSAPDVKFADNSIQFDHLLEYRVMRHRITRVLLVKFNDL